MKVAWKRKEDRDAQRFGGTTQPGSGNTRYKRGDVKAPDFLVEDKTTKHKSFSVTQVLWETIRVKAINTPGEKPRIPILSIEFLHSKTELVVLDINDFLALLGVDKLENPSSA